MIPIALAAMFAAISLLMLFFLAVMFCILFGGDWVPKTLWCILALFTFSCLTVIWLEFPHLFP